MRVQFRTSPMGVLICILSGCASAPEPRPIVLPRATPAQINYIDLQNRLGLDIPPGQTGLREKAFDACDLGPALAELSHPLVDCHHAFFTLIHFQLSCRSEEQPNGILTESDLQPLKSKRLSWTLGKTKGGLRTDADGQGVVRAISGSSERRSYLKVSTGADFLMVRANEINAVITPASWCE